MMYWFQFSFALSVFLEIPNLLELYQDHVLGWRWNEFMSSSLDVSNSLSCVFFGFRKWICNISHGHWKGWMLISHLLHFLMKRGKRWLLKMQWSCQVMHCWYSLCLCCVAACSVTSIQGLISSGYFVPKTAKWSQTVHPTPLSTKLPTLCWCLLLAWDRGRLYFFFFLVRFKPNCAKFLFRP